MKEALAFFVFFFMVPWAAILIAPLVFDFLSFIFHVYGW